MKKVLKFFRNLIYTLIVIVGLVLATIFVGHKLIFTIPYSATSTIPDIQADGFCLGVNCQNSPRTVEAFIATFANQIKHYNINAPSLWPDNRVVNLHAAVESIERNKSWLISPSGEIKVLTTDELRELCPVRNRYNTGFSHFKNDTLKGVYLALSEDALGNILEYEKYQYLGSYDLLLTYNHEMFHMLEQDEKWASPDTIYNRARNIRIDDVEARIERQLIYTLLVQAYAAQTPEQRDSIVLQAISNFENYKHIHNNDFKAAEYFDRIEGTAHYYEIISALYSAYPSQIFSFETVSKALKAIARSNNPKPYEAPGLDNEGYIIGAWAGFLLDEIQDDNTQWKLQIIENPNITVLDILAQVYAENTLPEPLVASSEFIEKVENAIQEVKDKKVAPAIFRMLYQLIF